MTLATEWKFCSIRFLRFICENTHKEFGIKIFEIDILMIFDLFTSPQGHQFDPSMKMLLAFCSACHPRRFDMPHDHVWKKKNFDPWAPQVPQSPTPGAWPRRQNKNPVWYVLYLSFVRTHTKFGIKIFEIDFVIEIKWYLTFWPLPRAPGGRAKKIVYVARPIYVSNSHTKFDLSSSNGLGGDSITDRQQDGIWYWPLSTPKSHP